MHGCFLYIGMLTFPAAQQVVYFGCGVTSRYNLRREHTYFLILPGGNALRVNRVSYRSMIVKWGSLTKAVTSYLSFLRCVHGCKRLQTVLEYIVIKHL